MTGNDHDITDGGRVGLVDYHEFGRQQRRARAASRWPLIRAVNQALEATRWRQRRAPDAAEAASNVTHLDPTGTTGASPKDWYLKGAQGQTR